LIEDLRYLASIRFAFILVLVAQIYFYWVKLPNFKILFVNI
jgi:hypothetical protein